MKDAMTDRSPSAETIRFVIEILSARATPVAELPGTIAAITQAVTNLGKAPASAAAPVAPIKPIARKPRVVRARKPVVALPAEPIQDIVLPAIEAAEKPAPRRGRPRRVAVAPEPVEETPVIEEVPVEIAAPQPRLLRRADAQASNEAQHAAEAVSAPRAPEGTLRGVVKWFDSRAGKGALRLTGISGDVILDPAALARAGVKRLYKDQEIEATVEESGGRVRLLSLSIPARSAGSEPMLNLMPGEVTGTLRRQPRSVQVQVKRDGIRQSAARAEAEEVFGGVGRIKAGRRLTP
jgi:cold shock CspA family protein